MVKYLPAELLLKLSDKLGMDLAEWFPQSIRNMDHNSLSVSRYINLTAKKEHINHTDELTKNKEFTYNTTNASLLCRVDVQVLQVTLELLVCVLQVKQSLQ